MKNLNTLTNKELEDFFNSFDVILSDVDGVLWNLLEEIPGTADAVRSLRKIGKKIIFVSNNTTKTLNVFHRQLTKGGFDPDKDDIVTPALAMISYLKKQNLADKKVFVMGMTPLKDLLREEGFTLAENAPDRIKETLHDFATTTIVDDGSVGCVIADVDINLNYMNLQKAATFLDRPEVLFLMGPTDSKLTLGFNRILLGPGYFHNVLEDITGRSALKFAKPSPLLNEYIVEKFKIKDRKRVLFIGDSISEDMGFASNCNYRKMLVLSGLAKKDNLENWTFPDDYKPDFYVDNLGVLHNLVQRIWGSKL